MCAAWVQDHDGVWQVLFTYTEHNKLTMNVAFGAMQVLNAIYGHLWQTMVNFTMTDVRRAERLYTVLKWYA